MPLDYSKWKKIEVSDDEDDTHPNIDTPSLFRWRHQARLERMAERKQEKEKLSEEKTNMEKRMMEIEEKLKASSIDEKERIKLELEKEEVMKQEMDYRNKEHELEEKERLEPWNVDTIGHEAFSKSRINKVSDSKGGPPKMSEEEESQRMAGFFKENEGLLEKFGNLSGFDKAEEFLLDHPQLASNFTANYLALQALNFSVELEEKKMCQYAEQTIIIQYLIELASTLHTLSTNTNFIKNFFKKMRAADPSYLSMFHKEVDEFCERLRIRGKEKRDAAIAEYEAEEKAKRIADSPGGLDPQEVFESLPEEMQDAFSSQDVKQLKDLAQKMDQEVFSFHLQRCIDSGLWVPNANKGEEAKAEGGDVANEVEKEN